MKLKLFFISILLLISNSSFGQQAKIDSLKIELVNAKNDDQKIKILEPLTTLLINNSSPKESLTFYNNFAITANKLKLKEKESRAYKYISECYIRLEDFTKAEDYALKALKISSTSNDTNFYLIDINQLGRVYHHFQKYDQAIETYNKGITRYKNSPQGKAICTIYSNLGSAYGQKGEVDKEINSFLEGSKYADKLGSYAAKSFALYNIAYLYMDLNQYEKSEKYYLMALKDSSKIEIKTYVYMNHHGLGNNYSRWGKYQKALKHNQIAYDYYKSIGNKLYQFDVLNNTAVVYGRINNPTKSIEYANLALKLALELDHKLAIAGAKQTLANGLISLKKYNEAENLLLQIAKDTTDAKIISTQTKSAIYQNLSSVYEGKKNYSKSLEFFKRYKNSNDSILIEQRDSNISEVETKYQTEKKEKENLQLKTEKAAQTLQIEKEQSQKWLLGGGFGTSIITLFIFGYYSQRNKKQKQQIENLQKELHHRVKNNLSIIDTFIEVAKEEFNNVAFDNKLTELQNRIASINQIHQQLYVNKDITNLNLKKYIENLSTNIENSFSNKSIEIKQHIDKNLQIDASKSFPIGLIVNEFITNSFKYAFENSGTGCIEIAISDDKSNYYVSLKDNGKGFSNDFNLNEISTFGIRIMKLLTDQLNGTFQLTNENGVNLNIQFSK